MFEFIVGTAIAIIAISVYGIEKRFRALGQFLVEWRSDWEKANNINQGEDSF